MTKLGGFATSEETPETSKRMNTVCIVLAMKSAV